MSENQLINHESHDDEVVVLNPDKKLVKSDVTDDDVSPLETRFSRADFTPSVNAVTNVSRIELPFAIEDTSDVIPVSEPDAKLVRTVESEVSSSLFNKRPSPSAEPVARPASTVSRVEVSVLKPVAEIPESNVAITL